MSVLIIRGWGGWIGRSLFFVCWELRGFGLDRILEARRRPARAAPTSWGVYRLRLLPPVGRRQEFFQRPTGAPTRRGYTCHEVTAVLSVLARGGFQRGQVHLDHPHHGFHGFGVTDQLADIARHNLPA